MGTGSRKTWLERQTDKVQIRVLSMDREGRKLEDIAAAVKQEFALKVPVSTLHNSIQEWGKRFDLEETLNLEMRRELDDICTQHPNADPRVLARGVIAHRLHEALKGPLAPKTLLFAAQGEGNLKLRERELAAKEETNRIRRRQLDLLERKLERAENALEETTNEAAKKLGEGKALTLDDINRIRQRALGLPPKRAGAGTEVAGDAAT